MNTLVESAAGQPRHATQRFRRVTWAAVVVSVLGWCAALAWPHTFQERAPRAIVWTGGLALARMLSFEIGFSLVVAGAASTLFCRRWHAPTALCAAGLLWMVPLGAAMAVRPGPASSPRPALRVMTFNILFRNRDFAAIAREVEQHDPDLVALIEYTAAADETLRPMIASRFPHRVLGPLERGHCVAIYSRLPITSSTVAPFARSTRAMVRAEVEHEGRRVEVMGVHLSAPFGVAGVRAGRDEFGQLHAALASTTHPVIIIGDFNASIPGPQDESLGRLGWRSSWSAERRFGATWPAGGRLHRLMSVRIDHVYVPDAMACTRSIVGRPAGSDHRPVIADLVWRD